MCSNFFLKMRQSSDIWIGLFPHNYRIKKNVLYFVLLLHWHIRKFVHLIKQQSILSILHCVRTKSRAGEKNRTQVHIVRRSNRAWEMKILIVLRPILTFVPIVWKCPAVIHQQWRYLRLTILPWAEKHLVKWIQRFDSGSVFQVQTNNKCQKYLRIRFLASK